MSKSLGNTVDPSHIIESYGADTARLFILFGAPVERDLEYTESGVEGAFRFLKRFYVLAMNHSSYTLKPEKTEHVEKILHKTIKAVTNDLTRFSFNTAISRLMELLNEMYASGTTKEFVLIMIQLISPFAPFMAAELWKQFGDLDKTVFIPWVKKLLIQLLHWFVKLMER